MADISTVEMWWRGWGFGLSIAAPVGPIGLLCIRSSLQYGWKLGFAVGCGAALADAAYGAVAAFGLTAISDFLSSQSAILGWLGGLMMICMGVQAWKTTSPNELRTSSDNLPNTGLVKAVSSTFVLTITNPATILYFMTVFPAMGLAGNDSTSAAITLVSGVFIGSGSWWLLLSTMAGAFRDRIDFKWMTRINKLSGVCLFSFGGLILYQVIRR